MHADSRTRLFTYAFMILLWVTLVVRFGLGIHIARDLGHSAFWSITHGLKYFTVLTMLLVTLVVTVAVLVRRDHPIRVFCVSPPVINTLAASVILVVLVYSLMLRHLWQPEGLRLVVDILLHDVIPPLFLVYWWLSIPRGALHGRQSLLALAYPMTYLGIILTQGWQTGFYPYSFLDVTFRGYVRVLLNAAGLLLAFGVIVLLLTYLNRRWGRRISVSSSHIPK